MSKQQEKFAEWFNPDSRNFFGTGLTLKEFMALGWAERFQRSFGQQDLIEQRRRFHFISELIRQLDRIKARTNFATALADSAIMAIIEGDWSMVETWTMHFAENDDDFVNLPQDVRELYQEFSATLRNAHTTRPPEDGERDPAS